MISVAIEIPETGAIANVAEIIDTHTDVVNMLLTIFVGLFNNEGDKLQVLSVDHPLPSFPIPPVEEQWQIVTPVINAYQNAHPAPIQE